MKRVWITKYALTKGIFSRELIEINAEISSTMITVRDEQALNRQTYYHGDDWHYSEDLAKQRAEEMRRKKIANLEKQIKKLKALSFK